VVYKIYLEREWIRAPAWDDYWVACKAVLRQADGDFQMHFEFDDINRWDINPGNAKKAYDILVKDVFSKA